MEAFNWVVLVVDLAVWDCFDTGTGDHGVGRYAGSACAGGVGGCAEGGEGETLHRGGEVVIIQAESAESIDWVERSAVGGVDQTQAIQQPIPLHTSTTHSIGICLLTISRQHHTLPLPIHIIPTRTQLTQSSRVDV